MAKIDISHGQTPSSKDGFFPQRVDRLENIGPKQGGCPSGMQLAGLPRTEEDSLPPVGFKRAMAFPMHLPLIVQPNLRAGNRRNVDLSILQG